MRGSTQPIAQRTGASVRKIRSGPFVPSPAKLSRSSEGNAPDVPVHQPPDREDDKDQPEFAEEHDHIGTATYAEQFIQQVVRLRRPNVWCFVNICCSRSRNFGATSAIWAIRTCKICSCAKARRSRSVFSTSITVPLWAASGSAAVSERRPQH
jgi:hypothetical protein